MKTISWVILAIVIAVILVFVIAMANTPKKPSTPAVNSEPAQPSSVAQNVITTKSTGLGEIMTGVNGRSLYIFRADTLGKSTCYGQCANFWPPLLIEEGVKPTGEGITSNLGTVERTDDTYQVTANGMPLYYYAGDKASGDTNGQGSTGAGALWYVLSPSGTQITTSLKTASTPSSTNTPPSMQNTNPAPRSGY